MKTVELLAPVGKIENAYAAIENGADALFIGGKLFNARQYADNFTDKELEEIIKYSKLRGIKVYITVNTLIKNNEIESLFHYLDYLSVLGIDAVISQDLGVVALITKYFPKLVLHASTQMTAHSLEDVLFLKELGFKRVVLARELQLKEIKAIKAQSDIEIETFVHGALCYSYSGQCLMSSLIGGRSGNRGRCAQPCRMQYTFTERNKVIEEKGYLISLKDVCSIEFLPQLIDAGIHSFKIEGRMKSPEYVASVVKNYRKYIDLAKSEAAYEVEVKDTEELKTVFNRGGFSKGYYYEHASKQMTTPISPRHIGIKAGEVTHFYPKHYRATILLNEDLNPGDGIEIIRSGRESVGAGISKHYKKGDIVSFDFDKYIDVGSEVYLTKNHNLLKSLRSTYVKANRKLPIDLEVMAKLGEPIIIRLSYKALSITYEGEILEEATNAPITKEKAIKQLTKFGNTSFTLDQLKIEWDESGYIPISRINEIRRIALQMMEEKMLEQSLEHPKVYKTSLNVKDTQKASWRINVRTIEQLETCLENPHVDVIYWEWGYNNDLSNQAYKLCEQHNKQFYLALPYIMKYVAYEKFEQALLYWETTAIQGYLIRNYGEFNLLKESSKNKNIDYNLNVMNNEAINIWQTRGAASVTLSMEVSSAELKTLRGNLEKIVYGYIPVMTSQQCLLGHHNKCHKTNETFKLEDRKETMWTVQTDCEACVMQILTDKPIVVKHFEELKNTDIKHLRLNFTQESKEETYKVLKAYLDEDASEMKAITGVYFKSIE